MCGIAGLTRRHDLAPDDIPAVTRMTAAQAHRGPAASGIHSDNRVVLGHRRLAIIDLSPAADQPMSNEDGSIWLTYNGELYNHTELRSQLMALGHRFRSRSDTEVIVHGYEQWGIESLLEKLRGMFAFGLYDSRAGVVLARDRLGVKPLYYYVRSDSLLLFASELRALLASGYVPNERDMDAVAGFLLAGSVAAPRTIVKGVKSLLPGHYMVWGRDSTAIRKYWDLSCEPLTERADTERIRALLQDSVSRHLMSDVPLGVFLSGGVDSAAVVALASRAPELDAQPLKTLTVTFDETEYNEASETRQIAARFHTDHREIRVTRADFVREIPRILGAMDQPTNDGVNTYFVSKAARQAGLTVVLSGLGGDEVFWGYPHYRWLGSRARWLRRCPPAARRALSRGTAMWARARGRDNWMRAEFLEHRASSRELYLLMRGFFPPRHVMDLLEIGRRELDVAVERQFEGLSGNEVNNTGTDGFNYIEFKRYLHDQLLRDTDVFSMAHSIEVRVPLLDHPVVEYAVRVHPSLKMANGTNKPLLVDAIDDPLVLRAGAKKKRGFSFPMDRWLKDSGDDLTAIALSGNLLNRRAVSARWKEFRTGRLHWSRAWALTVLGAKPH